MVEKGYLLGGRYKILRLLGEGGMANVYLAEDIILCKKVAVKLLRLDLQKDPQTIHRFKLEAQSTSELSHPNIVSILDVGSCLLYTSPSPRDRQKSRMPSSA